MPEYHATFHVRRIIVEDPQGHETLLVELDIDCDVCGKTQGVIHGHHLATLYQELGTILAEHPALCGTVGTVTDQTHFAGGTDPRKAKLN